MPDFTDQYAAGQIRSYEEAGLSGEKLQAKITEIEEFSETYRNPFVMVAVTFMEVFPVGVIVALLSGFLLKRK